MTTDKSLVSGLICGGISVVIISILIDNKLKDRPSFSELSAY